MIGNGASSRSGRGQAPFPHSTLAQAAADQLCGWLSDDSGQDLVEYLLLGATMAFAGLLALNTLDDAMNAVYLSWDGGTQAIWEPQDPQDPH